MEERQSARPVETRNMAPSTRAVTPIPMLAPVVKARVACQALEETPDLLSSQVSLREHVRFLTWDERPEFAQEDGDAHASRKLIAGRLNACYNCLDRHLRVHGNKAAFIWVPEPEIEETRTVTYQELHARVNEFAAVLQSSCDLKTGDTVTLYMPAIPEAVVSMLACTRIGVTYVEVAAEADGIDCGERMVDSRSRALITVDGYCRDGGFLDHKAKADEAAWFASDAGSALENVLVWTRYPGVYSSQAPMMTGRDLFADDLVKAHRGVRVGPVSMPADAPLLLTYSRDAAGKLRSHVQPTGAYLAYVAGTSRRYQDIRPTDTYWCLADLASTSAHSYIVYGPLLMGATTILYEGAARSTDSDRLCGTADRLGVNVLCRWCL